MNTNNGQSAAKPLLNEESSTTIPYGSTEINDFGKRWLYLNKIRNVIYKITCLVNNKYYIGSAKWYSKRVDKHKWSLKNNIHMNRYLQNSYNKYGVDNFEYSILEYCNEENLLEREQHWLDSTKCYNRKIGYNISKLATSKKGTKMPKSAKEKIGNFWRGKKYTKEMCEKRKLLVTLNQGKVVIQLDKDGNILYEYPSISEAARINNISIGAISKQCSKNINIKITKSKKIFRYKDIV